MFKPKTASSVKDYLLQIDEPRKSEIKKLLAFIKKNVPKLKPFIMHNIIAFGPTHYKTKSGLEGDWFKIGLASQKQYISIYVCDLKNGKYIPEIYKKELGKVNVGRSCIRFKKMEDLNLETLKKALKQVLR